MQDFYGNNLIILVIDSLVNLTAVASANFSLNLVTAHFFDLDWIAGDEDQLWAVFWAVELVFAESTVAYEAQSTGIVWRIKLVHFVT